MSFHTAGMQMAGQKLSDFAKAVKKSDKKQVSSQVEQL